MAFIIEDAICPICGKGFIPAAYHSYKDKRPKHSGELVCSWPCACESERIANKAKVKNRKVIQMFRKDGSLLCEFDNAKKASIYLADKGIECNLCSIQKACSGELKTAYGFLWKYKQNESE